MRYDDIIPFTYQQYVIKIPSIYVRYTNKMTTNTLSELHVHVINVRLHTIVNYEFKSKTFQNEMTNTLLCKIIWENLDYGANSASWISDFHVRYLYIIIVLLCRRRKQCIERVPVCYKQSRL